MDDEVALQIARGAVGEAMKRHGDNKQRAIQELQGMADKDPQLNEAFTTTGYLDVLAKQSVKQ